MNPALEKKAHARKPQSSREQLKALIAAHPFAKGLGALHVGALADYAMKAEFTPGQVIFREGELANRFYLLLDGEVVLESRVNGPEPVVIQTLGAGDVLGWSWMFEPYVWHFDAQALKHTHAIFFYGTWLRENCERDHDFGYEMMKRMSAIVIQRMQAARKQLAQAQARAK